MNQRGQMVVAGVVIAASLAAAWAFSPVWLVLAAAALVWLAGVAWFTPWQRGWGATKAERQASVPGDELLERANFHTTRAIDIAAPPEAVFPWLAQMGQGRGGLYSYDALENLMGLNIHSADRILPQFQDTRVGDLIALEPNGGGYRVARLDPDRCLVLYTAGDDETEFGKMFKKAGIRSTWAFQTLPAGAGRTRLVVRWRADYAWQRQRDPLLWLIGCSLDPVEFVMERKMMLGIRERARRAATN